MHVVVVGWLYIVVMIAVVSDSLVKAVLRLLFLGVVPVGLWVWMSLRRKRRALAEADAEDALLESDDAPPPSRD